MRLKLFPVVAAGSLLAATTARATPTRVLGLGDLGRYVEDDSNVLMYPGLMQKYAHFMYVDFGGATGLQNSLENSIAGGLSAGSFVKVTDDLQLGVATSSFAPTEQNGFLDLVAGRAVTGNGGQFTALKFDAVRRYDFLVGYSLAKETGLGLRLSYGSASQTFTPDQDDKTSDNEKRLADSRSQSEFSATLGFSSNLSRDLGIDSSLEFTNYGLSYQKNQIDAFNKGGGLGIGANVRARIALTNWWSVIPQIGYRGSFFSLEETKTIPAFGTNSADVPKAFDPAMTQSHSASLNTLDFGAVAALKASKLATFWIGAGYQMNRAAYHWEMKAGDVFKTFDGHEMQYALPYVKFAFEMSPTDNIRVRAGAEKYAYSNSVYSYDADRTPNLPAEQRRFFEHTTSSTGPLDPAAKDFAAYLGVSWFTQSGLGVDFLLNNDIFKNGLGGLFAKDSQIAMRAAVSYKF